MARWDGVLVVGEESSARRFREGNGLGTGWAGKGNQIWMGKEMGISPRRVDTYFLEFLFPWQAWENLIHIVLRCCPSLVSTVL